ncbi:HNH endonuclease [Aeromonas veronii]|uniref:HNH endonuclease n=1 Tax=Aeromonas veronii TaxID=654 RepID=UPI002B482B51|nr:hypothetical protein [Aeromonas veronii]
MKKLNPPSRSLHKEIQNHKEIISVMRDAYNGRPTQKHLLLENNTKIFKRFIQYNSLYSIDSLQHISDSVIDEQALKTALIYSYESDNTALGKLKKSIIDAQERPQQSTCPYCGINSNNSMDHYLPKERYPEFSTLPINLIPSCTICNGHKSSYWREGGKRRIINFYLDDIPNEIYITCKTVYLSPGIVSATFTLNKPPAMSRDTFNLLEKHYNRLHLRQRYSEASAQEISDIEDSLFSTEIYEPVTLEWVSRHLERQAAIKMGKFGNNYWLSALLTSLKSNPHYLAYVAQEINRLNANNFT